MSDFFKRYEKKYIIDETRQEFLLSFIQGKVEEDDRTDYYISNQYYDTDDYELIRTSIEKPDYKEKIRLRTYGEPGVDTPVYIELKKKLNGIVYKRRFRTSMADAVSFLENGSPCSGAEKKLHTVRELSHFLENNLVEPKAMISYYRKALFCISMPEFRLTFDSDIVYRNLDPKIKQDDIEKPILKPKEMIMEIKTPSSIPVWFSKIMSELEIFPTSFSKYGTAYKSYIRDNVFTLDKKMEVGLSA